ncbi:hypothetical protein N5D27_02490 [Stutzerimonas stutzeri]|uniref:hypothetical protein n=1 Tax=Stutzerimonas stutzeri TaxID=316 RepID=UPI000F79083F|nr:hypothetical protein [Stutzerimonas stutzeri]MDH0725375.1 hypothetical protein [Stutzerimonas stutzeri]RRV69291.1 hypothetical protein EGJ18_20330 [Stutzerimonas stutzeri]
MNVRHISLLALGLAVAASAQAASHRLAYSKAENVEVFVDHADGQPWCSDNLKLRFAFAGEADQDAINRLLPKLGGLFASQCSSATQLSWTSVDATGKTQASGHASQAAGWVAQAASAAPAAPQPAAEQASAPTIAQAPAEAAASAAPAAPAATETAPATAEPESAKATQAAAPQAPAATPAPADAQPAEPEKPAPVEQAVAPAPVIAKEFSVNGWQPPLARDVFAKADFITEIIDQNGCRFRLGFKPEDDIANIAATSSGVTCGPDGYAQGSGSLTLNRRDGVRLHQFKGSFLDGLEIYGDAPQLPVVGIDQRKNLLLLLHSEPASKVHYLLRMGHSYGGHWNGGSVTLIALTENRELFRDLDSIRRTIDIATAHLDKSAPKIRAIQFYGMRDLEKGLYEGDRDFWLYDISLSRHYRTQKWEYDPARADNHLFAYERKEAELQRRAELEREREAQRQRELLARQAEQQLQLYRQLRRETRKPEELYGRILSDASYSPFSGGGYAAMMQGRAQSYSQIVHIDGKTDGGWKIDYPYAAVLDTKDSEQDADEGWFLVKGEARLDASRKDEQSLPLTLVSATTLQACSEKGCADLRDPLKLARHEIGDPDWTPEEARSRIQQAWPERAELQGDDE